MSDNIVWGADPEFAASYMEAGKQYVLPPVVLREDFDHPFKENGRHPIFKEYGLSKVHEDGCAFEMEIPPSDDWETLWNTIDENKSRFSKDVLSMYPEVCSPQLYSLPAMLYQVDRWIGRGPEFQMATIFGCDPDMDAFDFKKKCDIIDARTHPWRYFGGHIHASKVPGLGDKPLQAIWSMAFTAGLAAIANSDVPDLERERQFLYGRPGKFRVQNYKNGDVGIEYRTPSTRWTESKAIARAVFEWAEIGLINLFQGNLIEKLAPKLRDDVVDTISTINQSKAKELLSFISTQI